MSFTDHTDPRTALWGDYPNRWGQSTPAYSPLSLGFTPLWIPAGLPAPLDVMPLPPIQPMTANDAAVPPLPRDPSDILQAGAAPLAPVSDDIEDRDEDDTRAAKRKEFGDIATRQLTSPGHYYVPDASVSPAPYFLELFEDYKDHPERVRDAVSLRYIFKVVKSDPVALVRTRGMDGAVYQENEGFMQATFQLHGRSGDTPLDMLRFQKVRNFLQLYSELSKKNKNALVRGTDVQLALFFPFEAEAYLCDVISFDYTRAHGSSTNSFEFVLSIVTNSPVGNKWQLPYNVKALTLLQNKRDSYHTGFKHACLKLSQNEIPDLDAPNFKVPVRYLDPTLPPGCPEVAAGTTSLMRFSMWANTRPYHMYQASFINNFYTLMFAADLANSGQVGSGARFLKCIGPAYNLFQFLLSMRFYTERGNSRANMVSNFIPGVPVPTEQYVVASGDSSLYDVAGNVYGDRSRADDLITYNSFLDAYTHGDGRPFETGNVIAVPRAVGAIVRNGDVFGTDLLHRDGDLVVVGDNDIATVSGYDCYTQNLRHRMRTEQGSNKVYPRYGLRPSIGARATSDVPGDLRANVRSQLLADHRTSRIVSFTLTEIGDKVEVDTVVEPVGAAPTHINFTYSAS